MAATTNTKLGIFLMLGAVATFAVQDAIARYLAETYDVWFILMLRLWAMLGVMSVLAWRRGPNFLAAIRSQQPVLQILRGVILAVQMVMIVMCFKSIGLINTHAVFSVYPLIGAGLSALILGEKVGWRRWIAICVGFIGVLIMLEPGQGTFSTASLVTLLSAFLFALYGVLTRYVGRKDSVAVSMFWNSLTGFVVLTPPGLMMMQPVALYDVPFVLAICCTGMIAHWMLTRALEVAEASAVQPFSYTQLIFVSILGILIFGEELKLSVVIGTAVVIGAGLFTIWRASLAAKAAKAAKAAG